MKSSGAPNLLVAAKWGTHCSPAGTSVGVSRAVAVDRAGNVYLTDEEASFQHVDKLTPDGKLTVFAGNGGNDGDTFRASDEGRPATSVQMMAQGLTVDAAGNVYLAGDYGRIFRVGSDSRVHLVAGRGQTDRFSGDGGPAQRADLNDATGLVTDASGNLYIGDNSNFRVRKVAPNGLITTVAGNGTQGSRGDGGLATAAQLQGPRGLALDAAGNLYIADDTAVRKVTRDGMITTVAGNFAPANEGFSGQAVNASVLNVSDVALDHQGNIYIAARGTQADSPQPNYDGGLFVVTPDGILHRIIAATAGYDNNEILDVTADPQGNIYYAAACGIYRLGTS